MRALRIWRKNSIRAKEYRRFFPVCYKSFVLDAIRLRGKNCENSQQNDDTRRNWIVCARTIDVRVCECVCYEWPYKYLMFHRTNEQENESNCIWRKIALCIDQQNDFATKYITLRPFVHMFFYLLKSIPIVTYEIYLFTKVNADFCFLVLCNGFNSLVRCCFFFLIISFRFLFALSLAYTQNDPRLWNVGFSLAISRNLTLLFGLSLFSFKRIALLLHSITARFVFKFHYKMPVEKYRKCAAKGVTLDGFAFVDFVESRRTKNVCTEKKIAWRKRAKWKVHENSDWQHQMTLKITRRL